MSSPSSSHVVIFPFMAQGHTLPLLDLSKALSQHHIKVSIITTPSNAKSIVKYVANNPKICLIEIPFPCFDGLPKGCENTSQLPSMEFFLPFLLSTKQLQKPFEQVLQTMIESAETPDPLCVISDFFLGFTLASCQAFGVPRLVFHGMSVLSMAISKSAWVHAPVINKLSKSDDPVHLPGLNLPFILNRTDLPDPINSSDHDDPLYQFIEEVADADVKSWGVIVNTFEELEKTHIPSFESFYNNGAKAWCLGPLFLFDRLQTSMINQHHSSALTQWLDEQLAPDSVLYVSFGTQADVSDSQLDEVVFGLESSGFPFVWVVRSKTWSLPSGMEEKIEGGLIVKEWVDQRQILSHRTIGGFLSHCGWNSVLESISAGVPILAWPLIAEQPLNAKLIVDGLGAGLSVKKVGNPSSDNVVLVSREAICEGVKELMGRSKGRTVRERAEALGRVARRAAQEGGSSYDTINKLIAQLHHLP